MQQSRPLFWFCFFCTTIGLLCSFFALILPYWYARFPRSKNRFLHLGLWEICLEKFMPDDLGNVMYDGCFYLYDWRIRPLWPMIWRTWFVVCQAFATCSFITFLLAEMVLVSQACRLISQRGPRAVLFIMIVSSISCLCILISLFTMGIGVDDETKRIPLLERNWLQGLDQCTLSWSYGLTAVSFPGSFLTLVILGWFVYPKRSTKGLLSVAAWEWPTVNDWTCRSHMNDLRTSGSRSYSYPSRSVVSSGDGRTQSGVSDPEPAPRPKLTFRQPLVSATPSASNSRSHHSRRVEHGLVQAAPIPMGEMPSSGAGKLSSYDPRSPDTVSLLSYEQPPPVGRLQSPSNTVEEQSSIRTEDSNTKSFQLPSRSYRNGIPTQEDIGDWRRLPSPHRSSVATETLHGSGAMVPWTGQPQHPKLMSSHSALDTSIWSKTSSTPIQAARPMRRSASSGEKTSKKASKQRTSPNSSRKRSVEDVVLENQKTHPPVQAARRMRRNP